MARAPAGPSPAPAAPAGGAPAARDAPGPAPARPAAPPAPRPTPPRSSPRAFAPPPDEERAGRQVLRRSLLQIQQAVQADESKTLAERIARVNKVGQIFKAWVVSRDPKVQAPGLAVLAVLAHHDHAAKVLCQRELLEQLPPLHKHKQHARVVAEIYTGLSSMDSLKAQLSSEGGLFDIMANQMKSKDVAVIRHGLETFQQMCSEREILAQLDEERGPEALLKQLFDFASKDDTDLERNALLAIARLLKLEEYAKKVCTEKNGDRLEILVEKTGDDFASRKVPAALAVVNLCEHKELRLQLVRKRAFQLFVEMGQVESLRRYQVNYQRVAAMGIANLSCNYQMRDIASKVGVLDAVAQMLASGSQAVRRHAAKACAELTLHEGNADQLVEGGAIPPLLAMARSGDRGSEAEAVRALNNMAICEANQRLILKEGRQSALLYLKASPNLAVQEVAGKIMTRIRVNKMRFAGKVAMSAKKSRGGDDEADPDFDELPGQVPAAAN